jgi:hypothetical protein
MTIPSSSAGQPNRKLLLLSLPFLCGLLVCFSLVAAWYLEGLDTRAATTPAAATQAAPATGLTSLSAAPTPGPTWPATLPAAAPLATPTSTRVVISRVDTPATVRAEQQATLEAHHKALALAQLQNSRPISRDAARSGSPVSFSQTSPVVLAHYFAWYDGDGWDDCNISAADKPLQPYNSDDPAAIARHIALAQQIGLNGFTLHWFAPGDRTDQNFGALLHLAEGSNFTASVVFSHHIYHGGPASEQKIVEALRYILDQHGRHPNFLRLEQQPVIFFTDVYRTPGSQSPQQFWADVRAQVDPQRQSRWIAEGLDASYLELFDGLYVFKISHAAYPHDYWKSPRWGQRVRDMAGLTGQPKLWIATISPGWDDRRSVCKADVRIPNTPHNLDRADGATYEATFQAALDSKPDWLIVSSFNEWVEGSYIEPSEQYGDKYIQMTKAFVERFQGKSQAE